MKQYGVEIKPEPVGAVVVAIPTYADIQVPDKAASAVEVFREAIVALEDISTFGNTIIGEFLSSNVMVMVAYIS